MYIQTDPQLPTAFYVKTMLFCVSLWTVFNAHFLKFGLFKQKLKFICFKRIQRILKGILFTYLKVPVKYI